MDYEEGYSPNHVPANVTFEGLDAGHIVDAVAEKLILRWSDGVAKELRGKVSAAIDSAVKSATDEAVRAAVHGVLDDGFQETDTWGSPKGPKKTLRDIIVATLIKPDRDYSRETMLQKAVSDATKAALATELKAEMEDARKKFREQVDAVLNAKLQEALRASLGL